MKPVDVKDSTYIDSSKEVNDKDPKCKAGDHVRISKYKNIFAKGYTPNWHFNSWFLSCTRIRRAFINGRKNVFN